QVVIETDAASYAFRFMCFDDLEQVVIHVTMSLKKIFPDSSPGGKGSPHHPSPAFCPPQRSSPCSCGKVCHQDCLLFAGGFSETYAALCDYNGFAFREEIQWDVDNIYHSQDCREFNLLDFSHLESRDVALSVAALSFNLWFTKLSCKDFRLVSEISEQLLYMLSKSVMLEELVLENSGLKPPPPVPLAVPPQPGQHRLPFGCCEYPGGPGSKTPSPKTLPPHPNWPWGCGDRAYVVWWTASPAPWPPCHGWAGGLRVQQKGLGTPQHGADPLSTSRSSSIPSPIPPWAGRGASGPAGSSSTRLTSTMQLFGALVHGCHTSLVHLDLSKNTVGAAPRGVLVALLLTLRGGFGDFSRALLQGLADNSHISDLHLDLSSCELRSTGAQVIQDLIPDASSISHLDLSDNGFDPDMVTLVLSIGRSKSIRHVSLGKNFNIKSKEGLLDVLHRIVQLIQEDDCPLQSLSVAESRLKLGTNVLLSALGSNTSLVTLDISGNAMGDTGAKMLAKALQINTKLRTVVWDRNNTTAHGLLEVAQALERNYTLKSMPLPMSDVAQAYRSSPERTEEAVHKLQSCLTRNQLRRTLPTQTFRLQQGILTTSSEQMVNEICLSVQKHVDILSASCSGREVEADILCAEEAIRNANLSISILPLLYEAGNTPYQNGKLQHKLECLTEEASQTCGREIQVGTRSELPAARDAHQSHIPCTKSSGDGGRIRPQLRCISRCPGGHRASSRWPHGHALLPAACVAQRRVGEGGGGGGDDDDDDDDGEAWGGWLPSGVLSPLVGVSELEPGREANGLGAHRAPPSLSLHAAPPARPASTKDAEPASGWVPATQPATATAAATAGSLMDLPTAGEKLEHCTKARPRPNRRHKQPPKGGNALQPLGGLTFPDASSLPSPTAPETCPGSAPLAPSGSRTLKKKIGNFFAFKKPKSRLGSRCEKEPEGGPAAPRSRRSMLSDILRAPSKAGEAGKPLSKSEEGGLAAEPRAEPEHCQTPDSARRIRPKYSREGKSQSLILLPGEDEDALGVRQDKKRHLEKSEGELPGSFEQRVQVMLHRIGVTKGPAAEGKKQQVGRGSAFRMGDIVDSSADSPPSLKARTHSVSTGGSPVGTGDGDTNPQGRGLCPLCWHQAALHGDQQVTGGHGQGPFAPMGAQPWQWPMLTQPLARSLGWLQVPEPRAIPWGHHCQGPTALPCLPHRRTLPQPCGHHGAPAGLESPGEAADGGAAGHQLPPAPALPPPGRAQWATGARGPGGLEQQLATAGEDRTGHAATEGQPWWGGGCCQPPAHPARHRR
uniref:Capping protein regulator and myosin 1 linker 2 n=1 Tax=Calidris pygmaea TaxID=425635 RepID=A0A8C3JT11_9CHAR